jgi:GT2 family glycosyltransferase
MKIAVCILNYNGAEVIGDCIRSIIIQELPKNVLMTIVVIDNGSKDDSIHIINSIRNDIVIISNSENKGVPYGFNQCLDYAMINGFDYVFVTNNDVIIDKIGIAKGLDALERLGPKIIITPIILEITSPNTVQNFGMVLKRYPSRGEGIDYGKNINEIGLDIIQCDYSGIFLMRTVEINNERFREGLFAYWEDVDWCLRMKKMGYRVFAVKSFKLWHHGSYTIGRISGFYAYYATRNRIWFSKNEHGAINFVYTWMYILTFAILSIGVQMVKTNGNRKITKSYFKGIIDGTVAKDSSI